MSFEILGIGCCVPKNSLSQKEAAEAALPLSGGSEDQFRLLKALYRKTRISSRGSVLLKTDSSGNVYQDFYSHPRSGDDKGPGTRSRMKAYKQYGRELAAGACRIALSGAAVPSQEITHLVTVSCTGFSAPGIDSSLVQALGLSPRVRRLNVGFMGCQGLLNALSTVESIVGHRPAARVLVCSIELCSLHLQYGWEPEQIVCNALFSDGSGALVAGSPNGKGGWRFRAGASCHVDNSADAMTWSIGNHGFVMTLSSSVPALISRNLGPWLDTWLHENQLHRSGIRSWAIHPGGPRVLKTVEQTLELPEEATWASRQVLTDHGNMSSATMVFILDKLIAADAPRPAVALAFGPGLTIEAAILE